MNMLLILLGSTLLLVGGALLLTAAWGVLRLPDALSRQHAATKAGTLAIATVCLGALLLQPDWAWAWRLALLVGFLFVTLPLASLLLARAAFLERASGMLEAARTRHAGRRRSRRSGAADAESGARDPIGHGDPRRRSGR